MKILGIQTHRMAPDGSERLSAVDWWRVGNPLNWIEKKTDHEVKFISKVTEPDKKPDIEWNKAGKDYDVIHTSYIDNPEAYAYMRATCDKNHAVHIMDLDDNILEVDQMNPAYLRYYPGGEPLKVAKTIIRDVDFLTVSTPYLKGVVSKIRGKPTFVCPNAIDPNIYKYDPEKVPDNKNLTIGYQGSATHYTDIFGTGFIWAMRRILEKYPDVAFAVAGSAYEELQKYLPKDQVILISGERDFWDWSNLWQELPFDIGVAPLAHTGFNRAKSSIKYYEYALRKIPAIYDFWDPYLKCVKENETGFLAKDELEWEEKLSWLIENETLRRKIADKARKDVLENYTMEKNYKPWVNAMETAYNSLYQTYEQI